MKYKYTVTGYVSVAELKSYLSKKRLAYPDWSDTDLEELIKDKSEVVNKITNTFFHKETGAMYIYGLGLDFAVPQYPIVIEDTYQIEYKEVNSSLFVDITDDCLVQESLISYIGDGNGFFENGSEIKISASFGNFDVPREIKEITQILCAAEINTEWGLSLETQSQTVDKWRYDRGEKHTNVIDLTGYPVVDRKIKKYIYTDFKEYMHPVFDMSQL